MKHFVRCLAAACVALIFGCQNPDSTNPVASTDGQTQGTIAKPAPVPEPGFLSFDRLITYTNTGSYNEVMRAVGTITFKITKTPTMPIFSDDLYDVAITVAGEVSKAYTDVPAPHPAPWSFSGSSKDRVRIPDGKKVALKKTFGVQGASVPTILNVELSVSGEAVAVSAISLTRLADLRPTNEK